MILYLVSKGANLEAITKSGQTIADMARTAPDSGCSPMPIPWRCWI